MTALGIALDFKKMGVKFSIMFLKYILDAFWGVGLAMTAIYSILGSDTKLYEQLEAYHPSRTATNILITISIIGAAINLIGWAIRVLSNWEDYREKKRENRRKHKK